MGRALGSGLRSSAGQAEVLSPYSFFLGLDFAFALASALGVAFGAAAALIALPAFDC